MRKFRKEEISQPIPIKILIKNDTMRTSIYALLFLFLPFLFAFKEPDALKKKTIHNTNIQSNDSIVFNEATAYKMLYDNQVKSNDSILKTIFYALGGLGGAVILVFASNWWFNDKKVRDVINEIDIKIDAKTGAIKTELISELTDNFNKFSVEKTAEISKIQNKLQEEVTNSITVLTLKINEFTEKIRAEIKEDNNVLLSNYQKQLESFNENYKQQIASLNQVIISGSENLKEIMNGKVETLNGEISNAIKYTFSELSELRQNISRNEYYLWDTKGVHRNAFFAEMNEIEAMLNNTNRNYTDYSFYLKGMKSTLEKAEYIYKFDKDRGIELLNKLPEVNRPMVQEIFTRLEQIKLL